jgi:DNA-binding transcriptional ArsR family regulator
MPTKRAAPSTVGERLLRAASHPLRIKAFSVMAERPASPKEIAAELGEDVSNVNYHVGELKTLNLIEVVEEETGGKRRGATEHFYRAIERPMINTEDWSQLPLRERVAFSTWIVQLAMLDISRAMEEGTFDGRVDRHLSRAPLLVDEQGWQELSDLEDEALDRRLEIQAKSAERMNRGGGSGISVFAFSTMFEGPRAGRPDTG